MSAKLLGMVLDAKVPHHLKMVLVILADHTNGDTGRCDPSLARIAKRAGCSERTVRRNLGELVELGMLERIERPGATNSFVINSETIESLSVFKDPGQNDRGHNGDPDTSVPPTPDTGVPPPRTPASPKPELNRNKEPEDPPPPSGAPPHRASRLKSDWSPSQQEVAYATDRGWTEDQVQGQAENFRDYWTAKAGKDGAKLDWTATWRRWVREAERMGHVAVTKSPEPGSQMNFYDRMRREFRDQEEGQDA